MTSFVISRHVMLLYLSVCKLATGAPRLGSALENDGRVYVRDHDLARFKPVLSKHVHGSDVFCMEKAGQWSLPTRSSMFICFCKQQLLLAKINHVAACKNKWRSNYMSKESIQKKDVPTYSTGKTSISYHFKFNGI